MMVEAHKRKAPHRETSPGDVTPEDNKMRKINLGDTSASRVIKPYSNPSSSLLSTSSERKDIRPVPHIEKTPSSDGSAGNAAPSSSSLIVDPHFPQGNDSPQSQPSVSTNRSKSNVDSAVQMLEAGSGVTVHVDLDERVGEYVVKIKRSNISIANNEHKLEETKQLAENAGMLLVQAEVLRHMGEQLLIKYRESVQRVMRKPALRIDFTHHH